MHNCKGVNIAKVEMPPITVLNVVHSEEYFYVIWNAFWGILATFGISTPNILL